MRLTSLVLALSLSVAACSTNSVRWDRCPAYPASALSPTQAIGAVKVQYLGSGGYLIQRGEDVVLFGPVYSNPGLTELGLGDQIRTDRALVDALLPADALNASAIIVGHSHYDHLMDTPYIANTKATRARVFGSATMKNLIASVVDQSRLVDVGPSVGSPDAIKINDRMRLWPIKSGHLDQMRLRMPLTGIDLPMNLWRGEVSTPLSAPPSTASEWARGEVYAYVLDFMDAAGTTVEFRLYYQDAGTDEPVGYPGGANYPKDGRPIDLVLLSAGGDFERSKAHPEGIIKHTRPRFVVLGHWENFFEPQTDICRTKKVDAIPRLDVDEFMDRAEEALSDARLPGRPILPCPTASVFHFPVDRAGDAAIYQALKKPRTSYDCASVR